MDPKKKNIILISLAVVAMGYAGYSLLFSGNSTNAQKQRGPLVKKTRAPVDETTKKTLKKKASVKTATKKELVKKVAQDRQKNTLKKKRGKRGGRKTKKKEILPAA